MTLQFTWLFLLAWMGAGLYILGIIEEAICEETENFQSYEKLLSHRHKLSRTMQHKQKETLTLAYCQEIVEHKTERKQSSLMKDFK